MFQARVLGAIDTGHGGGETPGTPGSTGGSGGTSSNWYNRPYRHTTAGGVTYTPPPNPYTPPGSTQPPMYPPPGGAMPPPLPLPPTGQPPAPTGPTAPPQTAGSSVIVNGVPTNGADAGYVYPTQLRKIPTWVFVLGGLSIAGIVIALLVRSR